MIIRGNTVGATMPRTNYNQTDSSKPDYLVGKDDLDQKIADAKKAGTDAAVVAGQANTLAKEVKNTALMKAGGKMSGDIDMDGMHILNLPTPTEDTDIVTKKWLEDYVDTTFLGGEW
jgi:hypothetical protein